MALGGCETAVIKQKWAFKLMADAQKQFCSETNSLRPPFFKLCGSCWLLKTGKYFGFGAVAVLYILPRGQAAKLLLVFKLEVLENDEWQQFWIMHSSSFPKISHLRYQVFTPVPGWIFKPVWACFLYPNSAVFNPVGNSVQCLHYTEFYPNISIKISFQLLLLQNDTQ